MSADRKLLILWGIVAVVYISLFVLTNPLITLSPDEQRAFYHEVTQDSAIIACESTTQGMVRVGQIAARYQLTMRAAAIILRHGYRQGWGPLPCGLTDRLL